MSSKINFFKKGLLLLCNRHYNTYLVCATLFYCPGIHVLSLFKAKNKTKTQQQRQFEAFIVLFWGATKF